METLEMKTYIGTKVIQAAKEMSRKEYCEYRGWKVPEDENPEDRVYLVEYEPDATSKPNHPNHIGYISMSPKNVFEIAYRPVLTLKDINTIELESPNYYNLPEYKKRIISELVELDSKINKLDDFILANTLFGDLPKDEQTRLVQQCKAMQSYCSILVERINAW